MSGEGVSANDAVAKAAVLAAIETIDELKAILDGETRPDAVLVGDSLLVALVSASDEVEGARAAIERTTRDFEEVSQQRDGLLAEVAKLKAKPAVTRKPASPRREKLGAIKPLDEAARAALVARLEAGEPFRLVASDGKHALRELDVAEVSGPVWVRQGDRMRLTAAIDHQAAGACSVAGFALVDAAGEQLGWSPLPDPVAMQPGSTIRFGDCILV